MGSFPAGAEKSWVQAQYCFDGYFVAGASEFSPTGSVTTPAFQILNDNRQPTEVNIGDSFSTVGHVAVSSDTEFLEACLAEEAITIEVIYRQADFQDSVDGGPRRIVAVGNYPFGGTYHELLVIGASEGNDEVIVGSGLSARAMARPTKASGVYRYVGASATPFTMLGFVRDLEGSFEDFVIAETSPAMIDWSPNNVDAGIDIGNFPDFARSWNGEIVSFSLACRPSTIEELRVRGSAFDFTER